MLDFIPTRARVFWNSELAYCFLWLDYMLSSVLLVNFQNNMASKARDLSKFVEFGRKIIGVGKNYRLVTPYLITPKTN